MYFDYFGLKLPPFNNTPDPRFFFNTPDHEEALASLIYAVQERKGFVLVTGEVGAGKTLLSRMVLNRLEANIRTAVITHTRLSGTELLAAICREFEIDVPNDWTTAQYTRALETFLLDQYSRDRLAVVIIDEAQNLPNDAMEELRMLGNLEADDAKLLQVLLLGQPELQETFRDPSMRQTFQRVFRTFHLKSLDRDLTRGYVDHRLRVAGLPTGKTIFDQRAYDAIFEFTEGIPRLVNQLCDNALLAAFSESRKTVSAELIADVVDQMMTLSAKPAHNTPANSAAVSPLIGSQPGDASGTPEQVLTSISKRLAGLEKGLTQIGEAAAVPGVRLSPEGDAVSAQRLHGETLSLIQTINKTVREADRQIKTVLDCANRTAEAVQSRAMATLNDAKRRQKTIRKRARMVMEEVRDGARDQRQSIAKTLEQTLEEVENAAGEQKSMISRALAETRAEVAAVREQHAAVNLALEETRAELKLAREHRQQALDALEKASIKQGQLEEHIRVAIESACQVPVRIEQEAKAFLGEARIRNAELQEQIHLLIGEARSRSELAAVRSQELIDQNRAEVESMRQRFNDLAEEIKSQEQARNTDFRESIELLRGQAQAIVAQLNDIYTTTKARADHMNTRAEELSREMLARAEAAQSKISADAETAAQRIREVSEDVLAARGRILAEAEESRLRASKLIAQTEQVLTATREQCGVLLADLRQEAEAQARKADEALRARVAEGVATLSEITEKLSLARRETERSRDDLSALIQTATTEVFTAQRSLENAIAGHRTTIAQLSGDAAAIKVDFEVRFNEARSALDEMIREHRIRTVQRAEELAGSIDHRLGMAESDAAQRVESLKGDLRVAGESAARISSELKTTIDLTDAHLRDCQTRAERDAEATRRTIAQMLENARSSIDATRSQVDSLTRQASETTGAMRTEISLLKDAARSRLDAAGQQFQELLGETRQQVEVIRHDCDAAAVDLAERMAHTQEEAEKIIGEADRSIVALKQQSKASLLEVRECLTQMIDRADQIRREVCAMGDEVSSSARLGTEQVQKAGERIASQIETVRDAVQRDADANFRRLTLFREQVEQSAEQIRSNAATLLDQVRDGAANMRNHADELLARAQDGAEKFSETAARLFEEAQASSARFREQAEDLLKKAEAVAADVREQTVATRAQITGEAELIRQQITAARHDLAEARQSVEQIGEKSITSHQRMEAQSAELLRQAESVQAKTDALLSMPKDLVDEARRQADALSTMSRKISTAIKQLATAENQALQNKSALDDATSAADEKLNLLKRHTERIGQLVGIIRQLYGTMDARIGRLRGRLTQVDHLVRDVPREIESLRAAFEGEEALGAAGRNRIDDLDDETPITPAPRARRAKSNVPATPASSAAGSTLLMPPPKTRPRTTPARSAPANTASTDPSLESTRGSLGQLVQKSQQLNDWLKEVVGEQALESRIPRAADKPDRPMP